MVKNHKLAKSISDASWSMFRDWVEYFGKVTIAVPPQYTSQNCSTCGTTVKKALSERTHQFYRYQKQREDFIAKFFGDFLT